MSDLTLLFEQYLFISAFLSLFILFYQLPSITSYFSEKPAHSQFTAVKNLTSNIVIKRCLYIPHIQRVFFSFQRLKIKLPSNKDLEDCCHLL
jgi:hypothetical protein